MNRERLAIVERAVRAAPTDKFDMEIWSINCPTAHCAAGWTCVDPEARALGLGLDLSGAPIYRMPDGMVHHGYDAMAMWLECPRESAVRLFNPTTYPTWPDGRIPRGAVLRRIRHALRTGVVP